MRGYAAAVRKVVKNFAVIGGQLWLWRPEPCLVVSWTEVRGAVREIGIAIDDISVLAPRLDGEFMGPRGYAEMKAARYSRSANDPSSPVRNRCFSVADRAGLEEFVAHLRDRAVDADIVADIPVPELDLVIEEAASPDFERLELGRSARDLVNAADAVPSILKRLPEHAAAFARLRKAGRGQEFLEADTLALASAIRAFDVGPSEDTKNDLLAGMLDLRERLEDQADYIRRTEDVDLLDHMHFPAAHYEVQSNRKIEIYDVRREAAKC